MDLLLSAKSKVIRVPIILRRCWYNGPLGIFQAGHFFLRKEKKICTSFDIVIPAMRLVGWLILLKMLLFPLLSFFLYYFCNVCLYNCWLCLICEHWSVKSPSELVSVWFGSVLVSSAQLLWSKAVLEGEESGEAAPHPLICFQNQTAQVPIL